MFNAITNGVIVICGGIVFSIGVITGDLQQQQVGLLMVISAQLWILIGKHGKD